MKLLYVMTLNTHSLISLAKVENNAEVISSILTDQHAGIQGETCSAKGKTYENVTLKILIAVCVSRAQWHHLSPSAT